MITTEERKALIAARGFIERGWTRGWFARTENGKRADALYPTATCWCVMGALQRAIDYSVEDDDYSEYTKRAALRYSALASILSKYTPRGRDLLGFNDSLETTKEDVLNLFDRALAEETRS
jgi:hypothetical protein